MDLDELVVEESVHGFEGVGSSEGGRGESFGESWESEAG